MSTTAHQALVPVEEYLNCEADGRLRHEYIAGEIFALTGASLEHNIIAGNIFTTIANHLRGGNCRAFMSDFKVRLKNNMEDIFYRRGDGCRFTTLRTPQAVAGFRSIALALPLAEMYAGLPAA